MAERGWRGWGTVLVLSLVTASLSIVNAALLVFVPLCLLLVGLPPRRPVQAALVLALAAALFFGRPAGPLWYAERGWVLMLGGWFLLIVALWPAGVFFSRALSALAGAGATAVGLALLDRRGWRELDWSVARRLRGAAAEVVASWGSAAGIEGVSGRFSSAVYQAAELQAALYPALLALGSLAALGVAWWMYRRLTAKEPQPLRPLREFRFRDELVWLLIAGILLVLLPVGGVASRTGTNLLTFMGALYALRGGAVMLALLGAPGPAAALLGGVAALLLYPLFMAAALVLGLSDTWLDLRARGRSAPRPGS